MTHFKSTFFLFLSLLFSVPILGFSQTQKEMIYVGTFTERGSQGIYVFEFERSTGNLIPIQTIVDRESPNYLDFHPNGEYLYAVNRQGTADKLDQGSVSTFRIDQNTGKLALVGTIATGGVGPCHISVDPKGRLIYISHYASSHMTVFALDKKGEIGELVYSMQFVGSSINPDRQKESHLHSIVPSQDGRFFYASDMGADLIHQFSISGKSGNLKVSHTDTLRVKPGSGPRHFTMHPSVKFALSVDELTSTVALYAVDSKTGELGFKKRENMITDADNYTGTNTAADIQVTPDGKFVYASNRGLDNIAIFRLDEKTTDLGYMGQISSQGKHPRSIAMDKLGEYLFVTNRDTDNLILMKINKKTGLLSPTGTELKIPGAVVVKHLIIK